MKIRIILLSSFVLMVLFSTNAIAAERTDWWPIKKHWDNCKTKDHPEDLEYMSRVPRYAYIVPHENPIKEIAVLPPRVRDASTFKSMNIFEKKILLKKEEIEGEYLVKHKKWSVKIGNKESFKILKKAELYDKYQRFIEEFNNYRSIDKDILSEIGEALDVDTVLLVLLGYIRPGIEARPYSEFAICEFNFLDIFLFDTKKGKIIWEFGKQLESSERINATQWKGIYIEAFKTMPVE